MKKLYLLSFLLPFVAINSCYSQDTNYASNIQTTISDGKKLFINYDIVSNDGSKYFHVVLELMYQGTLVKPSPNNLFGSLGHAITFGNKVIYWDYENDFNQNNETLDIIYPIAFAVSITSATITVIHAKKQLEASAYLHLEPYPALSVRCCDYFIQFLTKS